MIHDLTPDLIDPMLLAEATVPPLHEVIGLRHGEVTLTYDPTIHKPVRIKPDGVSAYDEAATRRVEDFVDTLGGVFTPFHVSFLKAHVRINESAWPLNVMTPMSTLQLFYLRAQTCIGLVGEVLRVDLSISRPPGVGGNMHATVNCSLNGEAVGDSVKEGALLEYRASVEALWSRMSKGTLGYWMADNGVTELRFSGAVLVNPRQAMAAIGQPVPGPIAPAA
jgi:hypothetical protein